MRETWAIKGVYDGEHRIVTITIAYYWRRSEASSTHLGFAYKI
jgi:hypothetical protein